MPNLYDTLLIRSLTGNDTRDAQAREAERENYTQATELMSKLMDMQREEAKARGKVGLPVSGNEGVQGMAELGGAEAASAAAREKQLQDFAIEKLLETARTKRELESQVLEPGRTERALLPETATLKTAQAGYYDRMPQAHAPRAPRAPSSTQLDMKLRQEFNRLPLIQRTQKISEAYPRAMAAPGDPGGDMTLLYTYITALDPSSTVREGEVAMANQAGGVPANVVGLFNKAVGGGTLSPQMRAYFKSEVNRLWGSQLIAYKQKAAQYRRLAEQNGLNPDNVASEDEYKSLVTGNPASSGTSGQPRQSGGARRTDPNTGESREWNGSAWVPVQ